MGQRSVKTLLSQSLGRGEGKGETRCYVCREGWDPTETGVRWNLSVASKCGLRKLICVFLQHFPEQFRFCGLLFLPMINWPQGMCFLKRVSEGHTELRLPQRGSFRHLRRRHASQIFLHRGKSWDTCPLRGIEFFSWAGALEMQFIPLLNNYFSHSNQFPSSQKWPWGSRRCPSQCHTVHLIHFFMSLVCLLRWQIVPKHFFFLKAVLFSLLWALGPSLSTLAPNCNAV